MDTKHGQVRLSLAVGGVAKDLMLLGLGGSLIFDYL